MELNGLSFCPSPAYAFVDFNTWENKWKLENLAFPFIKHPLKTSNYYISLWY